MVKTIMYFANGTVMAFDEAGQQVPEWQGNLLCIHLRRMKEAGVISDDTNVEVGRDRTTVAHWIG